MIPSTVQAAVHLISLIFLSRTPTAYRKLLICRHLRINGNYDQYWEFLDITESLSEIMQKLPNLSRI